jgi:type IV fimbrial biogenesis protein FimT
MDTPPSIKRRSPLPSPRPRHRGTSMLEALFAISLAGLLLGAGAAPALQWVQGVKFRLSHAELARDLQGIRLWAVSGQQMLRWRVETPAGGSCYLVHTGPDHSCRCLWVAGELQAQCQAGSQALKVRGWPAHTGMALYSNVNTLRFDPLHGTASPAATLRLVGPQGQASRHVVNLMGRSRQCLESGRVSQLPRC